MSGEETENPVWRELRNAKLCEWVGDADAVAWLLDLFDAAELFDDLVDGDREIDSLRAVRVLDAVLVDMPANPFFQAHANRLLPLVATGIQQWLDANDFEMAVHEGDLELSYVLRSWNLQIVHAVVGIVRGRAYLRGVSSQITRFFTRNESLETYRKRTVPAPTWKREGDGT